MRTLQEKYNAIQEGKFSKDHFLAEARMQQPQLITRFNGYDDAVQILKNRGMIVEAKKEETVKEAKLTEAKAYSFTLTYNDAKYVQRVLDDAGVDAIAKAGTFDDEVVVRAFDGMGLRRAKQALEADHFDINENIKEAKLTKKSLTDYRYKPTNDMDKYPYEQILRGLRVELEGLGVQSTPTPDEYKKALAKVLKNLEKDEIYYTNQVAGVKANQKRNDQMVAVEKNNSVDTLNGLKKAQLKEAFKKVIKNILKEEAEIETPLHGEEEFEMQGPKSDIDFRNELEAYLEDNQIYGYTKIHDIMTQEDPIQAAGDLALFLDNNQIYGYNRGIEAIYDEYPYEDMYEGYEEASDEEDQEGDPGYQGYESPSDRMYNSDAWVQAQQDMMETKKAKSVSLFDMLDENYETDPYNLNDKTDYKKMGAEAFYHRHKKRNQNPYPLDSPAGIDWDKGWDEAQSAESDSYKGY